jgi:hypothetical protein
MPANGLSWRFFSSVPSWPLALFDLRRVLVRGGADRLSRGLAACNGLLSFLVGMEQISKNRGEMGWGIFPSENGI